MVKNDDLSWGRGHQECTRGSKVTFDESSDDQ